MNGPATAIVNRVIVNRDRTNEPDREVRNLPKFHERRLAKIRLQIRRSAVDAQSFTIFGEPPAKIYSRTNDALILSVSQSGFIFLDLFDTGNRSSRASNAPFNFYRSSTYFPRGPRLDFVISGRLPVRCCTPSSTTQLAFRSFRLSGGSFHRIHWRFSIY